MRWLAVLLQIAVPGCVSAFFVLAMWVIVSLGPAATSSDARPAQMLTYSAIGGAVLGLAAYLVRLLTAPPSLVRLALTVALSILGLVASYLMIEVCAGPLRGDEGVLRLLLVAATFAAPLAGALAGSYWPPRTPHIGPQGEARALTGLAVLAQIAVPVIVFDLVDLEGVLSSLGHLEGLSLRIALGALIVYDGAIIGVLVWLLGCIRSRASLARLGLAVAFAIVGMAVRVIVLSDFDGMDRLRGGKLAAPILGALAGYYWPRRGGARSNGGGEDPG